jgi:hypothetical protein
VLRAENARLGRLGEVIHGDGIGSSSWKERQRPEDDCRELRFVGGLRCDRANTIGSSPQVVKRRWEAHASSDWHFRSLWMPCADAKRVTFVPLTSRSQLCPDRYGAAHLRRTMTAEPLSDEALLRRLVAFDTTSHKNNREIADFISDYLDRPGVRITRHSTADGAKLNLIVAAGPEDGDRGLPRGGCAERDWYRAPHHHHARGGKPGWRGSDRFSNSVER